MTARSLHRIFLVALFCAFYNGILAQPLEYRFTFQLSELTNLDRLSQMISIDKIDNGVVWAYASPKEMATFRQTGIEYELCPDKNASKLTYKMAKTVSDMQNWDRYPTYSVYDSIMRKFAGDYPSICKLEVVGTLASGRQLLSVKISSDVDNDNTTKPEMLCTGSMHGDEEVCMVTTLRLCQYLLENYRKVDSVTNLVDNAEIWILPLYNPDGMYRGGNNEISSSTRGNANSVDLNRNFPHVNGTKPHPDGNDWQQETLAMMDFFEKHHFTLSANIHGGNECFNYPWDTWQRTTADDEWWKMVGANYRDMAQKYSPSGYFDDNLSHSANGLTNGWSWYSVTGGQQDYANYYAHCREATIEISSSKTVNGSTLPNIWEYNYRSLLKYFSEGLNGVCGTVTDIYGNPLNATVTIDGFDKDNSWVETDARAGDYHRLLKSGTYKLTFSAEDYVSQTIEVTVVDGQPLKKDIVLNGNGPLLKLLPVTVDVFQKVDTVGVSKIVLSNIGDCDNSFIVSAEPQVAWLSMDKTEGDIPKGMTDTINLTIDSHNLQSGDYSTLLRFASVSQTTVADVRLTVQPKDTVPHTIDTIPYIPDTVHNVVVTAVSIAQNPDKLVYTVGDSLNLTGGMLNVTYSNDSTAVVSMRGAMVVSFDSRIAGMQIVVLEFEKHTVSFEITINADEEKPTEIQLATSISVVSLPVKLAYNLGDTLDLTGGMLNVKYSNGVSVVVPMKNEMIVGNTQVAESQTVIVKIDNCITMFSISLPNFGPVNPTTVKSVSISSLPYKLTYQIGDTLDLNGATINVTYSNDSTVSVAVDGSMVTGFDSEFVGSKMLTVNYSGSKFQFYVNVIGGVDVVDDASVSNPKVYAVNRTIIVENAKFEISVFNVVGYLICKNTGNCECTEIKVPTSGIYIVKVDDRSQRVVVE